ncbi:hypothetical protein GCM10011380_06680 [Sphingomonas metalli]|uniref:DUF2631 domain-containing protein n=1 Tax=Sphingomonas metalli TaxID=1779358 RepID=A0A916SWE9_9SPHN|nr:hypothetical protein [Sphingomonas metalli]GGB19768.1 hypothetical protein GCM10011380_06680 [Sphingomonas metalli]
MTGDEEAWFAPKRFGWGYTPVRWQGWLATGAFAAIVVGLGQLHMHPVWLRFALIAVLAVGFIGFAAQNSRGR